MVSDVAFSQEVARAAQTRARQLDPSPDAELLAELHTLLGINANNLLQDDTARHYYTLVLAHFENVQDSAETAQTHYMIGMNHLWFGRYAASLRSFEKGLRLYSALGDREGEGLLHLSLATAFHTSGRYVDTERQSRLSFRIAAEVRDTAVMVGAIGMVAQGLAGQGRGAEAVLIARQTVDLARAYQVPIHLYEALGDLGVALLSTREYAECIKVYTEAGDIAESLFGERYVDAEPTVSLAMAFQGLGRMTRSLELLRIALAIVYETPGTYETKSVYDGLTQTFVALNRYDSAYHYSQLASAAKDSLYLSRNADALSELETRYQTAEKQREIESQTDQLTTQRRNLYLTIGLLALSLLGVGIVGVLAIKLRRRTRERETLVHEVHHRVKNNLQVLSSLLYLQRRHVTDPVAVTAIQESQHRVEAMGLIHQRLYSRGRLTEVRMDSYLQELTETLRDAFGRDEVAVAVESDAVEFPVQLAIEIGLIANELISNAFKYAFAATDALVGHAPTGTVWVRLRQLAPGRYRFEVADDGVGASLHEDDFTLDGPPGMTSTGFGTQLVGLLSQKLGTMPQVERGEGGYRTWLEFSA